MNYLEAKRLFLIRCNQEKHTFPYGKLYEDESFVEVEIPLTMFRDYGVEDQYSALMSEIEMDPVWIKTCKKKRGALHPYWDGLFVVADGNHRIASARKLGRTHIKAMMPESHCTFWRNLNVESS